MHFKEGTEVGRMAAICFSVLTKSSVIFSALTLHFIRNVLRKNTIWDRLVFKKIQVNQSTFIDWINNVQ